MADISNKTLAVLVGVAIVVSLVGLFSVRQGGVTGAAVANNTLSTGEANFTIESALVIRLDDSSIQFGTGFVNSSVGNNVTLDSFAATTTGGEGFVVGNVSDTTSASVVDSIHIRNEGNQNFQLDVNSSKTTDQFIGGSSAINEFQFRIVNSSDIVSDGAEPGMGANTSQLYVSLSNDTSGACASGAVNGSFFGDGNFSGSGGNASLHTLCSDFQYQQEKNEMDFFVRLVVPEDSPAGQKTTTLTFTAIG